MAVRASVDALPEPGHAVLRLTGLEAAPEGLALSIQRQQGPDSHLGDDGWRRTETWLQPGHVERRGDALAFHLGPEICDRLAGIATVRVRVREPDIGVVGTTVVAWPVLLTSGALDPSRRLDDETLRLRRPPAASAPPPPPPEARPDPAPEPPPAAKPVPPPFQPPRPDLRASRALEPPPPSSGRTAWLIAALVLVVLAGGGYHVWATYFQKPDPPVVATPAPPAIPPATASAGPKSVRDTVGEYLATRPTPEAMLAKGREFAKAGNGAAAFLVFRRAAESGSVAAQVEYAAYLDPLAPKAGFAPDGPRAVEWYERAALAGSAEAQRRLGLLLAKGGAGLAADPAKAKGWLQQAAAQNDAEARKALDALPK